jgi:hypothetical protein
MISLQKIGEREIEKALPGQLRNAGRMYTSVSFTQGEKNELSIYPNRKVQIETTKT